jgi:hypothetical protein
MMRREILTVVDRRPLYTHFITAAASEYHIIPPLPPLPQGRRMKAKLSRHPKHFTTACQRIPHHSTLTSGKRPKAKLSRHPNPYQTSLPITLASPSCKAQLNRSNTAIIKLKHTVNSSNTNTYALLRPTICPSSLLDDHKAVLMVETPLPLSPRQTCASTDGPVNDIWRGRDAC